MAYDPRVIRTIDEVLDEMNASPRVRKAAYEATLVETGGRNLHYGDRDSLGPFQQRPSQGWGTPQQVTDPRYAATQFVKRAIKANATGKYGSAGALAQAVQGSAFPDRYDQRSADAESILAKLGGASSRTSPGSTSSAAPASSGSGQAAAPILGDPGTSPDFTGLLSGLLSSKPSSTPATGAVQAPQFASRVPLPDAFHAPTPEPVKAPEAQDGVSASLSLLGTLGGSAPTFGQAATTEGENGSQVEPPAGIAETVGQVRTGTGPVAALGWAKSYLGFKETGENQGGIASYANERFGMSKQPWCAMFTSLAITKGGAPLSARTASVAEVRRKALAGQGYQRGLISPNAARAGDLILFGDDHIGMVDSVQDGKIRYVGGNQSDGVTMASVPVGRGDIVRPLYGARGKRR